MTAGIQVQPAAKVLATPMYSSLKRSCILGGLDCVIGGLTQACVTSALRSANADIRTCLCYSSHSLHIWAWFSCKHQKHCFL